MRWRPLRRGLSLIILLLFLYALLGRTDVSNRLARTLGGTQLVPGIMRLLEPWSLDREFLLTFLSLLLIMVFTLFFGRVYCSLICPLGISQDCLLMISRRLRARGYKAFHNTHWVRYTVFFLSLLLFFAGSLILLNLLDPFSVWSRLVREILLPLTVPISRGLNTILNSFGFYFPLADFSFFLPVSGFVFLFLLLLIPFTLLKGRVYCSWICPVGTFLGFFSLGSRYSVNIDKEQCSACGFCERVCKTGSINAKEKRVNRELCILCGNCLQVCPGRAIGFGRVKKILAGGEKGPGKKISRRSFLKNLCGFFFSAAVLVSTTSFFPRKRRVADAQGGEIKPATPPGSLGIVRFSSRCVSCHLCISKCPGKVLQPSLLEYGLSGIFQPVMDFKKGFCEYECTLCGEICPAGAILPVSAEKKKTIQIGRVEFIKKKCVVETKGTICGACAEVCPTHAVTLEPYREGLGLPVTEQELCIGCGSCEFACPVPEKAIFVQGLEVHGTAKVITRDFTEVLEVKDKGFPF